jgi:uncharacterized protein YndB with AHSA1/START domain
MGHQFEQHDEAKVDATPEEIWERIATGPGIDTWFMGHSQVEPGTGGVIRTAFGGYDQESRVTAWEPGKHLAYTSEPGEDGRYIAFEFLIEGREGGSTVLRAVTTGFLPGDDWETEFEAMRKGGAMYFRTLVESASRFAGRTCATVTVFGPPVADWGRAWAGLRSALGLSDQVAPGDRVHVEGAPAVDGTVFFANEQTLAIRTDDAILRFVQGFMGGWVLQHHLFGADADPQADEAAWQSWLATAVPSL